MLGRQKAFALGPTVHPCTFGIWMWDTPFVLPSGSDGKAASDTYYILLDTEGLAAPDASPEWDAKIFILSLLLSSYFIYNTMGKINRDAIQKLSLMATLTEKIQVDQNSSDFDDEKFTRI